MKIVISDCSATGAINKLTDAKTTEALRSGMLSDISDFALKSSCRLEKCLNNFQIIYNYPVGYPSFDVVCEFVSL